MKLVTRCNSCNQEIFLPYKAATRAELQMKNGDEVKAVCSSCGATHKKHLNDIYAEESKIALLIAMGVGMVVSAILWYLYGIIGVLGIALAGMYGGQQYQATRAFNRHRIRRKL